MKKSIVGFIIVAIVLMTTMLCGCGGAFPAGGITPNAPGGGGTGSGGNGGGNGEGENESPEEYTITYELNGGSWAAGFTAVTKFNEVQSVTLPVAANVVKNGHSFVGWY